VNYPTIPKNPVTLTINGWITDQYLRSFFNRFLPEYDYVITSGQRTQDEQQDMIKRGLKPSQYSSHLYNLARDFVITRAGKVLPDLEMAKIWREKILPYWEGYTYFSDKTPETNTGWVHANIERDYTKITRILGIGASLAAAIWTGKKIFKKR
jgi:hypothetical protein